MPRRTAVVLGHSHTGALTAAVAGRTLESRERPTEGLHLAIFEAWHFHGDPPYVTKTADGADTFNPEILQAAHAALADDAQPAFITLFGGNAHTVLSLMRHQRPFDFVLPEAADLPLDPQAEILPLRYVQTLLQSQMDPYLYQLYRLRQAVPDRIYAVAPPPPIGNDLFITDRLDSFFLKNWQRRDLSPRSLRHKMWRLQTRLQKQLCDSNAVELIEPPGACWTSDGFLHPSCYGPDATHGGLRYGELLLEQIEEIAGAPLVSWSTFSIKAP